MTTASLRSLRHLEAVSEWERSVKKYVWWSRLHFLNIIVTPFSLLAMIVFDRTVPKPISLPVFALYLIVLFFAFRRYAKMRRLLNSGSLKETTALLPGGIGQILSELMSSMRLKADEFKVFLDTRSYSGTPSIQQIRRRKCIVLPLGFLKIVSSDPMGAKTLLAHELGHVKQRDTDLQILNRIYLKAALLVFGPIFLLSIPLGIVAVSTEYIDSAKEVERDRNIAILNGQSDPAYSFQMMAEERRAEEEPGELLSLLIVEFAFGFFFLWRVKRNQSRSEQLADQAAALFGDPFLARELLNKLGRPTLSSSILLKPSVQWRANQLWSFTSQYRLIDD